MAYESPLTIAEVIRDISANMFFPQFKENLYGAQYKLKDCLIALCRIIRLVHFYFGS